MRTVSFSALFVVLTLFGGMPIGADDAVTTVRLWPADAPGALGDRPEDIPQMAVHRPDPTRACGTGIVVCPGGGYQGLAMGHEGQEIAAWLNELGVAALVLDYRHRGKGYGHPAPSLDVQRAIRIARARAPAWGLDRQRIGVLGFSAGGHLAATAATRFDAGRPEAEDPVERFSCRPDFAILCYPVIALGEPFTHVGSERNLLGPDPDPELIRELSLEKQVTAETPPTFLFHTDADEGVPAENSLAFYSALREHDVPAELHIYAAGRHGVGLARNVSGTADWPKRCATWMQGQGFRPEPSQP